MIKKTYASWLVLALLAMGCMPPLGKDRSYFDCKRFFEGMADSLQSEGFALEKTISSNGKSETVVVDAPDWKKELRPFTEIDITKPALRDLYDIRETRTDSETVLEYVSNDLNTPVKSLRVTEDGSGKLTGIVAISGSSNPYHASSDTLVYHAPDQIEIHAHSSPTLGKNIAFSIKGKIIKK